VTRVLSMSSIVLVEFEHHVGLDGFAQFVTDTPEFKFREAANGRAPWRSSVELFAAYVGPANGIISVRS
jgi:hypothetical protein